MRNIEKIGRIVKIGNSKGIVIDKDMLEYLNLDTGDVVKLTIEKIEDMKPRKIEKEKR